MNLKGIRLLNKEEQRTITGSGSNLTCSCAGKVLHEQCRMPNCTRIGECVSDHMGGLVCAPY